MDVMREVRIQPVLNGFMVQVGCQSLVFNRIEDVADNLVAYQKDPAGIEKKFVQACVNKTLEQGIPVPTHNQIRLRGEYCAPGCEAETPDSSPTREG